jgi:hypothetical protein
MEVGARNANWRLVGVCKKDYVYEVLGSITFMDIVDHFPSDRSELGRWESASIVLPKVLFRPSLTD